MATHKFIVPKGAIGDQAWEWMSAEEKEAHRKYVKELEEKGELGQPQEITFITPDEAEGFWSDIKPIGTDAFSGMAIMVPCDDGDSTPPPIEFFNPNK